MGKPAASQPPNSGQQPPLAHPSPTVFGSPKADQQFEQSLQETRQALKELRDRYLQIRQDRQTQAQLHQRSAELADAIQHHPSPDLQDELKTLQQQLTKLEVRLESHLIAWDSLREYFWQMVRFGGLGLVLGWVLKSCAGG